jgi:ribosomal-protein-alanine N-acetyltransferase
MNIRAATVADIPAIIAIEQAATGASHWSAEKYKEIFTIVEGVRTALIVEDNSIVNGFLVARTIGVEWEIENIAVAADLQRGGLGSNLLHEFVTLARQEKVRVILLETRESNRAARGLYAKFSFEECGVRKDYYRNPDDHAVMYRLYL